MYSQTTNRKTLSEGVMNREIRRRMAQEHHVDLIASIDGTGRLALQSGDARLKRLSTGWRFTPGNDDDTAVYRIGDFHAPAGTRVAVRVYSLTSDNGLVEWDKREGRCCSPAMKTGTQLRFFVTAVRAPAADDTSSPSSVLKLDDFELRYGGGKIETLKNGGGGDGF